MYLVKLGA